KNCSTISPNDRLSATAVTRASSNWGNAKATPPRWLLSSGWMPGSQPKKNRSGKRKPDAGKRQSLRKKPLKPRSRPPRNQKRRRRPKKRHLLRCPRQRNQSRKSGVGSDEDHLRRSDRELRGTRSIPSIARSAESRRRIDRLFVSDQSRLARIKTESPSRLLKFCWQMFGGSRVDQCESAPARVG